MLLFLINNSCYYQPKISWGIKKRKVKEIICTLLFIVKKISYALLFTSNILYMQKTYTTAKDKKNLSEKYIKATTCSTRGLQ